jgi:hypothetical protein
LGQPNNPLYKSNLRLDVGKSYKLWALEGESCWFPVWFCFGQAISRTGNLFPKKSFKSKMSIDIIELFCPKPIVPIYFGQ